MFKEITSIDLFDLNVGMTCANVRLRCSKISPVLIYLIKIGMWYVAMMFMNIAVLIYLIKMWVWHVPTLDSDVHGYHWY